VLISGIKRSGTTILWETFRKDPRNLCFDEPFHPSLWQGKRSNGKGTWLELGSIFDRVSAPFAGLEPIRPLDELTNHSDPVQRDYLRALMMTSARTVIDDVRLWNRLPEILPSAVPVVVVHLFRDPVNWVTAQLMPSNGGARRRMLYTTLRDLNFFRRRTGYNAWRYEEVTEAALSANHPIFHIFPHTAPGMARMPAYMKLLALWWAANIESRARLASWRGGTVVNVTLSEFAADPAKVLARIYAAARWELAKGAVDFTHVRPIRPSWKASSRKWNRAFSELGIPYELSKASDGDTVASVLDEYLTKRTLRVDCTSESRQLAKTGQRPVTQG
jgi:hypothetical protein